MATLKSKDGKFTITTEVPAEIAQLRAEGFRVQKETAPQGGGKQGKQQGGDGK